MVLLSNGTGLWVEGVQEHQLNITNSDASFVATALMKFLNVVKSNA